MNTHKIFLITATIGDKEYMKIIPLDPSMTGGQLIDQCLKMLDEGQEFHLVQETDGFLKSFSVRLKKNIWERYGVKPINILVEPVNR